MLLFLVSFYISLINWLFFLLSSFFLFSTGLFCFVSSFISILHQVSFTFSFSLSPVLSPSSPPPSSFSRCLFTFFSSFFRFYFFLNFFLSNTRFLFLTGDFFPLHFLFAPFFFLSFFSSFSSLTTTLLHLTSLLVIFQLHLHLLHSFVSLFLFYLLLKIFLFFSSSLLFFSTLSPMLLLLFPLTHIFSSPSFCFYLFVFNQTSFSHFLLCCQLGFNFLHILMWLIGKKKHPRSVGLEVTNGQFCFLFKLNSIYSDFDKNCHLLENELPSKVRAFFF